MSTPQNQNQSKFVNFKAEVVKEFFVEGGMVLVYLVTPETILDEFYVATFDNGYSEVAYGMGHFITEALQNAEREWDKGEEEPDTDNPFREVLIKLGIEGGEKS